MTTTVVHPLIGVFGDKLKKPQATLPREHHTSGAWITQARAGADDWWLGWERVVRVVKIAKVDEGKGIKSTPTARDSSVDESADG
jgi:hypothetical protein